MNSSTPDFGGRNSTQRRKDAKTQSQFVRRAPLRLCAFALKASALITATGVTFFATAADWPQWGGRNVRNMYSPQRGLPDAFGKIDFKPGTEDVNTNGVKNLKWVAKIGSQSYGNVTVAGGRVFIGTNNEPNRDPKHQGDRSILLCFDEKTGKFLWQLVVPKLASGKVNDWESLGLLSSPTVEGDRVYLVTSRCEVICLDRE